MSLRWRALLAFALVGMLLIRGLGAGVAGNSFSAYDESGAFSVYCGHASSGPDDGSGVLHPDCCVFCAEGRGHSLDSIFIVATLIALLFPNRDISGNPTLAQEKQPPVDWRAVSVAQPRAPPILS